MTRNCRNRVRVVGSVREPPLLLEITAYFRHPENQPGWGGLGGEAYGDTRLEVLYGERFGRRPC